MKKKFLNNNSPKYNKAVIDFPQIVTIQDSSYINALLRKIIYESTEKRTGSNIIVKFFLWNLQLIFSGKNTRK